MLTNEELIAESDEDLEIGDDIVAGFDFRDRLVIQMEHTDFEQSRFNRKISAVIDEDELSLIAKALDCDSQDLPKALSERFAPESFSLRPSEVEGIFQEILEFILDCGCHYKLERGKGSV